MWVIGVVYQHFSVVYSVSLWFISVITVVDQCLSGVIGVSYQRFSVVYSVSVWFISVITVVYQCLSGVISLL